MTKRKITLFSITFIVILIFIAIFFMFKQFGLERSNQSLLNQYYQLRKTNPLIAKQALELILKKEPNNQAALHELGYFYLQRGDTHHALMYYEKAHQLYPDDSTITFDYAKLLQSIDDKKQAKALFVSVYQHGDPSIKEQARMVLNHYYPDTIKQPTLIAVTPSQQPNNVFLTFNDKKNYLFSSLNKEKPVVNIVITNHQPKVIIAATANDETAMINQYYELKKKDKQAAWKLLEKIIEKYPNYVVALKEAGYTELNKKDNKAALPYFLRIYALTCDATIAMQLGYIYNGLNENHEAYKYFSLATQTDDKSLFLKAQIAMTNLRDAYPKFIKDPFFLEVYSDPFYFTRFDLMVYPEIGRFGFVANKKHQLEIYTIFRRTTDNDSEVVNNIPQIFEDNAQIIDVGIRVNPIPNWPVAYFIEMGRAKDLVYQNRPRWRNDFRTGLALYQAWGVQPTFTMDLEFPMKQVGDVYADIIYYSRYKDIIATARIREGFRLFEYECMMVDLYFKGFLVGDSIHQFYNNIVEVGPGIAFTPINKFNFVLRYETVQGYYLPVNGPSVNPYGPRYRNSITQADFFIRF